MDKDMFTEHHLDSTQNLVQKNCETKSIILAPFNSTRSNLDPNGEPMPEELPDSIKELMVSRRVIKFGPRVRDIEKQYEINNNADMDNGVYNRCDQAENGDGENQVRDDLAGDGIIKNQSNPQNPDGSINSEELREEREILDELKLQGQKKKEKLLAEKEGQVVEKSELEKLQHMINDQEQKDKA